MATADPEDFWRKTINDLSASLPEDGDVAPEIESIKSKKVLKEGLKKVYVQRIVTQVFIFTDVDGKAYTSGTSQKLQVLGQMSLQKALKMAQENELT